MNMYDVSFMFFLQFKLRLEILITGTIGLSRTCSIGDTTGALPHSHLCLCVSEFLFAFSKFWFPFLNPSYVVYIHECKCWVYLKMRNETIPFLLIWFCGVLQARLLIRVPAPGSSTRYNVFYKQI